MQQYDTQHPPWHIKRKDLRSCVAQLATQLQECACTNEYLPFLNGSVDFEGLIISYGQSIFLMYISFMSLESS